ncbi:hypothetical protein Alsa1_CDS0128 [Staphylococcus phage Alsa_1]|nr:hypothetical protein Alsa1_CDS0128 [Staphylococcus phage Alsa_1]
MVGLNEIKQYINDRLDKVTTVNGLDFRLTNTLDTNDIFCIVFTVDNDSLIFGIGNSIDNGVVIIVDKKIKEHTSFIKVNTKQAFVSTLYGLLDRYTKYQDKVKNNGIEQDIFDWH